MKIPEEGEKGKTRLEAKALRRIKARQAIKQTKTHHRESSTTDETLKRIRLGRATNTALYNPSHETEHNTKKKQSGCHPTQMSVTATPNNTKK